MEKAFKTPNKNTVKNEAVPTTPIENSDERIKSDLLSNAQKDLDFSCKSTTDFIMREKERLGIEEDSSIINSKIENVIDKHTSRRKKLLLTLASKIKKVVKYTTGGIAAISFTAHFAKQEYPEYLSKDTSPQTIEWNESTEADLNKLAHEYVIILKEENKEIKEVPDSVVEKRFMDFVAKYGPDIKIVHPGDDMDLDDKLYEYVFEDLLKQLEGKAHYVGGTLVFKDRSLERMEDDTTKYDLYSGNMGDFIAEFSHHINKDWSLRRGLAYAEDLARQSFKQHRMYEDPFSGEYQAHRVTQTAIATYLFEGNIDKSVAFEDIYNLYQDYYRKFTETKGYERNEDIEKMNWMFYGNTFEELQSIKGVVFKNLDFIRSKIDDLEISDDLKGDLFGIMVPNLPIENPNNNYEIFLSRSKDLCKTLELKRSFFEDKASLDDLIKDLEDKYQNDDDYFYAHLSEIVFDDDLVDKIRTVPTSHIEHKLKNKFFKLNLYGIAKSIESTGVGYVTEINERDFNNASYEYELYLESVKKNTALDYSELYNLEVNKKLISTLSAYIDGNKDLVDDKTIIFGEMEPTLDRWQYNLLIRLRRGVKKYEKLDIKRDFFENNQSPLINLLDQ